MKTSDTHTTTRMDLKGIKGRQKVILKGDKLYGSLYTAVSTEGRFTVIKGWEWREEGGGETNRRLRGSQC